MTDQDRADKIRDLADQLSQEMTLASEDGVHCDIGFDRHELESRKHIYRLSVKVYKEL